MDGGGFENNNSRYENDNYAFKNDHLWKWEGKHIWIPRIDMGLPDLNLKITTSNMKMPTIYLKIIT